MEDCKTLELSIEKTKIYAENYKYLESKPNVENLLKIRRKSNNSTCSSVSSATTLASDHAETPQSCGRICVFNLHQKLIFNCEFCDLKYGDLENFGRHLHEVHNLLLQTEEPVKENAGNESKSNRISNVVKKEPLEPAINLPPSYFTEPLVSCGNVFIVKERRFLMACGYCDCTKYDNLEMFEKHIKTQHNILEGVHNELNVVPKVEEIIKEEFTTITELEEADIKEEVEQENETKIKVEQNSKEHEDSVEKDEEIESGEEFQDIESDELTANKKDTTRNKKKDKNGLSTEKSPYACEHCEKKCEFKSQLKRHVLVHTGENPYECDICNKRFRHLRNCKEHYKKHLERRINYDCELCEKKFMTKSGLTVHNRVHTGEKPYECDICHTQYHNSSALWQHKKRLHLEEAGQSLKCQYCDKKFMLDHELIRHIRVHTGEKPFKCDICNKFYSSIESLSAHKKLHSGILKTLKCHYCDKFFRYNRDRLVHMRVHTGEKPFKCGVCQRCFTKKHALGNHVKKIHPATVNKSNDVTVSEIIRSR